MTTSTSVADIDLREVPIGTGQSGTRTEADSMGAVEVPAEHYWGAPSAPSTRSTPTTM